GHGPQRYGDDRCDTGHVQGADDGMQDPAGGHRTEDADHIGAQEVPPEPQRALDGHQPQQGDQWNQRDQESPGDQRRRQSVLGPSGPLDHMRGDRDRDRVQHRRHPQQSGHRHSPGEQREEPRAQDRAGGQDRIRHPAREFAVPPYRQRRSDGVHQLAPENSARRLMIHRARRFTAKVSANRISPEAISTFTPMDPASGKWLAILAAIDWCWPGLSRKKLITYPGERTISTAMVSPSARPRPSIAAEITPDRPNGRTACRIISHRVAPRASEASSWSFGVCRNTSRMVAVMIGTIMIASTR